MTKYICMMGGCDFVSTDAEEARDHMGQEEGHVVAEVGSDEEGVTCRTFS